MTKSQNILMRLAAILAFIEGKNGSDRPDSVIRPKLPEALRVTQAELLASLDVKRRRALPRKLSHAVIVASRLHTGKDCYRTVKASVERLKETIEARIECRESEKSDVRRQLGTEILEHRSKINELSRELGEETIGHIPLGRLSLEGLERKRDALAKERNAIERRCDERHRKALVDEAIELKSALNVLTQELGEPPLDFIVIPDLEDKALGETVERLRHTLTSTAAQITQSSDRKRRNSRRRQRYDKWLGERQRNKTRLTFDAWERKRFAKADHEWHQQLEAALKVAEAVKSAREAA